MILSLKVKLYPTKQMKNYLDTQCDYRRYCWNKGIEEWNTQYNKSNRPAPESLDNDVYMWYNIDMKGGI